MKLCVFADPKLSPAMARVADALGRYRPPGTELTPNEADADLVVLHVIGYPETETAVEWLRANGKRYSIMQYCMISTQRPNSLDWLDIWRGAESVWSYYDLDAQLVADGYAESTCPWCGEDLPHVGQGTGATDFPRCFYFAPLGADPEIFVPSISVGERYAITTSGYVAESECVAECTIAAGLVGRRTFHLGPRLECHGDWTDVGHGITDEDLAVAYSSSDYVAGMRRAEGFELPAAEGLLCGARPLMLDRPHYRQWFEPFAEYVPETDPESLITALVEKLGEPPRPVSREERAEAVERFDWKRLVTEFWNRTL
jgi:hypothetical protein